MTKIILGEHVKGGTGLTTLLDETVKELSKTSKVLVIDAGSVPNLQFQYTESEQIPVLFKGVDSPEPLKGMDNVDVIKLTRFSKDLYERTYGSHDEKLRKFNELYYSKEYDYIVIDTSETLKEYSVLYWVLLSKDVTFLNVIEGDRFSLENHIGSISKIDTPRANKFKRVLVMNKVFTKDTLVEFGEEEESIEEYLRNYKEIVDRFIPFLSYDKFMVSNYSLSFSEERLYNGFVNKNPKDYSSEDFKVLVQLKSIIKAISNPNT